MAGKNRHFGKYGARGITGGEAIARQLDRLVTYIATPITQARGFAARLHYVTGSPRRLEAARAAGLTVTDRTLREWERGTRKPTSANLQRLEQAYRTVRRANVARQLQKRLEAGGGTRIEIHPFNQSQVSRPLHRHVEMRHMNVRNWDAIIRAWAHDDQQDLDAAWIDLIDDLGSQWGAYEYVTNVGFAA